MMRAMEEEYLTVAEASSLLRVAPSTLRRWIREGDLPAYRLGKRRLALRRTNVDTMIAPIRPASKPGHYIIHTDPSEIRKQTPEEVQRGLEALERARQINKEMLAERGGKPFESSVDIIHEMREERGCQLAEAMGWSSGWNDNDSGERSQEP